MFSMQCIQFFLLHFPNYFDEIYFPIEADGVQTR